MESRSLPAVGAGINLVLGALLAAFPRGLVSALELSGAVQGFYPSILGGVRFGDKW